MNKNIFETLIGSDSENDQVTAGSRVNNETSIKSFQGRDVVPLRVIEDDYPTLGSNPNKGSKSRKTKTTKKNKTDVIRFVVSSSYAETRQNHSRAKNYTNDDDPRSLAFSNMDDKETISKALTCTRVCNNVKRGSPAEEFGVCYRENCSFAHCLNELNDPMCGFDSTCRFRWGKQQRDGSMNTDAKCMFRHSDETRDDWIKRTGRTPPDLPETDDKTRNHASRQKGDVKTCVEKVTQTPVAPKKMAKYITVPDVPLKARVSQWGVKSLHTPGTPLKALVSKWGAKPVNNQVITPPGPVAHKKLEYSDDSDDSRLPRSRHSSHRRIRRINDRSRSPRRYELSRSPPRDVPPHVITVPTKELAEIAIKSAFDRGVYNIRVVVE